jgi:hypothetical protein
MSSQSISFGLFEQAISQFMDDVLVHKSTLSSKSDLIALWNKTVRGKDHKPDAPKPDTHSVRPVRKEEEKKEESKDEKCIFKITRGDRIGERCTSRIKQGSVYCTKHFKEPEKKEEKTDHRIAIDDKIQEKKDKPSTDLSTRVAEELKKKKRQPVLDTLTGSLYKKIKSTNVIVSESGLEIIGYLQDEVLHKEKNQETEQAIRDYQLVYLSTEVSIDE